MYIRTRVHIHTYWHTWMYIATKNIHTISAKKKCYKYVIQMCVATCKRMFVLVYCKKIMFATNEWKELYHTRMHMSCRTYIHIHICLYTRALTHTYIYMHTDMFTHTHMCIYTHICTRTKICINTSMYTHTHTHTHIHVYIHTYVYTRIDIHAITHTSHVLLYNI